MNTAPLPPFDPTYNYIAAVRFWLPKASSYEAKTGWHVYASWAVRGFSRDGEQAAWYSALCRIQRRLERVSFNFSNQQTYAMISKFAANPTHCIVFGCLALSTPDCPCGRANRLFSDCKHAGKCLDPDPKAAL